MKLKRRVLAFATMLMLLLQLTLPAFGWEQRTEAREADPIAQSAVPGEQITIQAQAAALQHPSKEEIVAKWNTVTSSTTIYATQPSITAPHVAGSLTDEFLESGLTYLNYVRYVAGLPEVTLDATLNEDAQHGAVVLAAIDQLTHYPTQPDDMDDAFFDRGAAATSSSNISARWGYSDLTTMLKSSVQGCMNDNNSLGNLTTVGHRRWLLNPTLGKVGFGYAESAENWSYIVTKVFDRSGAGCSYDFISWPTAGNHPTNLFDSQNPWSVTLNPGVYQTASAADLAITITRVADGKQWSLDGTTGEPNIDAYGYIAPYLTADSQGYGVRSCIIFHPGSEAVESYEGVFQVRITGLSYADGTAAELNYEVDFFNLNSVGCVHNYISSVTAPTCTEQGYTTYTCSKCGDSYTSDYTDPIDHSYEDGKCIWCGVQEILASGTCGDDLTWTLNENGTLTICGYGDMSVSDEETTWVDNRYAIRSVVIEEGVTSIAGNAFDDCLNLTSVQIPGTVRSIGHNAFRWCRNLKEVTIPYGVSTIGYASFANCVGLTTVKLPDSLNYIDEFAFQNCTSLSSIVIPEGIRAIGYATFCDCTSLSTVELPEGLTTIGGFAFSGCNSLKSVEIPQSVTAIEEDAFQDCAALFALALPDNLTVIGESAFAGCSGLKKMIVPGSVSTIGNSAFSRCTGLEKIVISEGVATLGENVFHACESLWDITLPNSLTKIGEGAFHSCVSLQELTVPANVSEIGAYAFSCGSGESVLTFLGDAPVISQEAFTNSAATCRYPAGNATWTEDTLQNYGGTITWVPYEAAAEVASGTCGDQATWVLTDNGVLTVSGTGATYDYYSTDVPWLDYQLQITSVVVKDGITRLGEALFMSLDNLVSADLSDTITEIGNFAFWGDEKLSQMELPANLESLGQEAFVRCALTSVEIPGTLTFLDACVFHYCTSLTDVVIHSGDVDSMTFGNSPFRGCTALEKIHVDDDHFALFDIDGVLYAYYNQGYELLQYPAGRKDTVLNIEDGTLHINTLALENATCLEEVTIPASTQTIHLYAFNWCSNLKTVRFLGDAPFIQTYAFNGVTADCYYPADNTTWTENVMQNYGGTLTWTPYGEPVIEEIASGWSGATQWTLTSDGVMTVYGSGNMKNYGYNRNQPWLAYADRIKSIVIEEGVAAIGTGAFMDLTKLESITLPETGLKTIGEAAFYGCSSLKSIDIPDTVYTVFDYTFKNCVSLEEVSFSKILIKIGQGAFENCTSLDYVYIPTNVGIIGSWSFKGCTGLVEADMTWADATKIREGAFKNCSALTTIHLPTNIQTLGDSCFYGIGATSFTVPATVTKIEAWCFARAYSLKSITFEGDAPSIGEGAFNKITLTAYYDGGNTTWTSAIMQNYGGTVTWEEN